LIWQAPVALPPTCEARVPEPEPEPGTLAFYRHCARSTERGCSLADPHPETLKEAARCATLRTDFPHLSLDHYDLADGEREAVTAAIASFSKELRATLDDLARAFELQPHRELSLLETVNRIGSQVHSTGVRTAPIVRQLDLERAGLATRPAGGAEGRE